MKECAFLRKGLAIALTAVMAVSMVSQNGLQYVKAAEATGNEGENASDTLNINDVSVTDSKYGSIRIDSSNVSEYNGKILTGSVIAQSTGDYARGLVIDGVTLNLTIENLTIDRSAAWSSAGYCGCSAIELTNGATLNLTLKGENTLKGHGNGGAGICVKKGTTLKITKDSIGSLTAVGGDGGGSAAGIGADACDYHSDGITKKSVGTILIEGGNIYARGGSYTIFGTRNPSMGSAGIGASAYGDGTGSITISGGVVTAEGGCTAAGIGGGDHSSLTEINISGGTVAATPGNEGAAIGSGRKESQDLVCGSISITGGTVTANGNIGYGGEIITSTNFIGGSVSITGGVVEVSGKIEPYTNIENGCIMKHYPLKVTIYDSAIKSGTATGTMTIGSEDGKYQKSDLTFTMSDGKATASLTADTLLYGEQQVMVMLGDTTYQDKTINLDIEKEIIWGSNPGLAVSNTSGVSYRYANEVLSFSGNGSATVTMAEDTSSTSDTIVVEDGSDISLTLRDITIDSTKKGRRAVTIGPSGSTKCKLVLEGENVLTTATYNGEVIAVGDGGTLQVAGDGYMNLTCGCSWGRTNLEKDFYYAYAAGIRAKNASVIFEGDVTVTVKGQERWNVPILGKDIQIKGGSITAIANRYGHGIGNVKETSADNNIGTVRITGGTIYGEGGEEYTENGGLSNQYTQPIISGGNVHMNRKHQSNFKGCQPKNSSDTLLYCTTIQVGKSDTLSKDAKVLALSIAESGGSKYDYGITGMYTDSDGKLYLWLPEGAVVSKVQTTNGTYTGTCTTNTEITSDTNENYWGTASATFTLSGSMFYPVKDISLGSSMDEMKLNQEYDLSNIATITPTNATNNTVTWTVTDAGEAGANITDNKLTVSSYGIFTLEAVVKNGASENTDYTKKFTVKVLKDTTLSDITMTDWTYGDVPSVPAYTTDSDATPKVQYKKKTEDNSAYTATVPTASGEYTVRVTLPETSKCKKAAKEADFVIHKKELTITKAVAADRTYDGTNTVQITSVELSGVKNEDNVSVDVTNLIGTLSGVNAGEYTSVTLPALTLTGEKIENYILVQPTSAVPTTAIIERADAQIIVGTPTYSKVYGDTSFSLEKITTVPADASLTYTVGDSKNSAGQTVEDDKVITVEKSGKVTIIGAGSATVTVSSLSESKNFKTAENESITINVAKGAAPSIEEVEKSYVYSAGSSGTAECIDIAAWLPSDRGDTTYELEESASYVTDAKVSGDGKLTYKVGKGGNAGDSTTLTVKTETKNYKDIMVKVKITLTDKKVIAEKEGAKVALTGSKKLTYGQKLSHLTLNTDTAKFVADGTGEEVEGTLTWEKPDEVLDAGTTTAKWIFTPKDTDTYTTCTGMVTIQVAQKVIQVNALDQVIYKGEDFQKTPTSDGSIPVIEYGGFDDEAEKNKIIKDVPNRFCGWIQ